MPIFAVLLMPVFVGVLPELLPDVIADVFAFIPTVAMEKVLRISFSGSVALSQVGPSLAIISMYTLILLGVLRWVLQRSDR